MLVLLRTLSDIVTAGIAITAFSLLLYALTFNLRDRIARSFALILFFLAVVYTAETITGIETDLRSIDFWMRLQWAGVVFLPAAYLHFSDALLAATGRPSRGRRRIAVRLAYIGSIIFLMGLPFPQLVGPVVVGGPPAPHLQPTVFTNVFMFFNFLALAVTWVNFFRSYRRTTTPTSRRRMAYLIAGALAPVLGAFPFLPYGPEFASRHQLVFWTLAVLSNILIGVLLVTLAYAVAFFGVSWPDRVVKTRLFKWIMRGPFTASVTLAVVTMVRRAGEAFGSSSYTALVPFFMVITILLLEYLITLLAPLAERWLFYGKDKSELDLLRNLENQLLTRSDLRQFLESVLATARDRMQANGAYIAALNEQEMELVVTTGKTLFRDPEAESSAPLDLLHQINETGRSEQVFRWGDDTLFPLLNGTPEQPELIGLLGVTGIAPDALDEEHMLAMKTLTNRAAMALQNRHVQEKIFQSLESLSTRADMIQRLRAAGQYDQGGLLTEESNLPEQDDLTNWVKDALSHYWGGPKLTQNPLMRFIVVQGALTKYDGNHANALRAILRAGIDRTRPEGERRFTGEWILYNILEMKFIEGRKVREVAMRLAMSEADLYRKQRIAIEAVAKAVEEMEQQARQDTGTVLAAAAVKDGTQQ